MEVVRVSKRVWGCLTRSLEQSEGVMLLIKSHVATERFLNSTLSFFRTQQR
jgi:hypothetical protein